MSRTAQVSEEDGNATFLPECLTSRATRQDQTGVEKRMNGEIDFRTQLTGEADIRRRADSSQRVSFNWGRFGKNTRTSVDPYTASGAASAAATNGHVWSMNHSAYLEEGHTEWRLNH